MARAHRPSTASIVIAAILGGFAVAALGYSLEGGWTGDGATATARLTARFAFVWFVVAWSASALARLWPGGWRAQLLYRRRAVGLGFAAAHGVHLLALLTALLMFNVPTALPKIVGGGLGYAFVAAMALTSSDAAVRALGLRNWKRLHAVGGYVLAAIFAYSYFNGLATKPLVAAPALAFISIAAVLRLLAWAKSRTASRAVA
jgi:DMSO/TMAO reductase YedYZ heme-binding membrane subunit